MESKPEEKISIEHLAASLAIGRRNFDRRFIKATGNTPTEYLQRIKVEDAKKSFETSRRTINEIMYEVVIQTLKPSGKCLGKLQGCRH